MTTNAGRLLAGLLFLAAATADARPVDVCAHAAVMESLSSVHPRWRGQWLADRGLDNSYYTTFRSPESTGLREVGRWPWGPSWELCGRDSLLFLGSGSGVRILSITDSVHPRMLGQIVARGRVSQLVVRDSLLFVACGSWGAQVYSVSDPANPRELGSMDAVIGDLAVVDTFCFAVGGDSLKVYGIVNPANPVRLGAVRDSGEVIAFTNGHAFCGGRWTMNIWNVRNPGTPQWVASGPGECLDMQADGNKLYFMGGNFSILNVSNPASIGVFGQLGMDALRVYVRRGLAYLGDHYGLIVVDVSDSTRPVELGRQDADGWQYDCYVARDSSYAYVASDWGGLFVYDVHDPASPTPDSAWYAAHSAEDLHVDGNRLYIADRCAGMRVVDISDPTHPQTLGAYDTVGQSPVVRAITARDSFAYMGWRLPQFCSVDVTDPSNPLRAGFASFSNAPEDMVLRDSLVYVASSNRFSIVNVARPREPRLAGSLAVTGVNLWLVDTLAYVASSQAQVVSVADPTNPRTIGQFGAGAWDVVARDSIAFLTAGVLAWYSVGDPSAPWPIDSIGLGFTARGLAVVDTIAYVGSRGDLCAVNVADLHAPRIVSRTQMPYSVLRVIYFAPYLYVCCWDAGVCILEPTQTGITEGRPGGRGQAAITLPNPTRGEVRLRAAGAVRGWRVIDVTGKVVAKGSATGADIDLSRLAPGVYIVRVQGSGTGGQGSSQKVVITR